MSRKKKSRPPRRRGHRPTSYPDARPYKAAPSLKNPNPPLITPLVQQEHHKREYLQNVIVPEVEVVSENKSRVHIPGIAGVQVIINRCKGGGVSRKFYLRWYYGGIKQRTSRSLYEEAVETAKNIVRELVSGGQMADMHLAFDQRELSIVRLLLGPGASIADVTRDYVCAKSLVPDAMLVSEYLRSLNQRGMTASCPGVLTTAVADEFLLKFARERIETSDQRNIIELTPGMELKDIIKRIPKDRLPHFRNVSSYVKNFAADMACPIENITTANVTAWLYDEENGISDVSINQVISMVRKLFLYAKGFGFLPQNLPLAIDGVVKVPKSERLPVEFYTLEVVRKILDNCSDEMLVVFVIGFFLGLRPYERGRLTYEKLYEFANVLDVGPEVAKKVDQQRYVNFLPNVSLWLQRVKDITPSTMKGKIFGRFEDEIALNTEVSRELARLEITTIYDGIRHTYGSMVFALLGALAELARAMGNSPGICRRHYVGRVEPETALAYVNMAPSGVGEQSFTVKDVRRAFGL